MRRTKHCGWWLATLLTLLLGAGDALAQDTVGKWAYRRLSKAHEALQANKYKEALSLMREMQGRKRLNDHERALMWQTFGFIYSGQERYKEAAAAFESCLALGALPDGAQLNTQYNLGQLYLSIGNFNKAIKTLEAWFKVAKNPSPTAYFVLAMAYAQTKKYEQGLVYAKQAVARVKRPQESWLQLLLSLHFELKQYRDAVGVLKRLIVRVPKKRSYWTQLSAVYNELGDENRSLAVMELAYRQGFLTKPKELTNLAQFYLQQGIPIRGAEVVRQGFKSGTLEKNYRNTRLLATCLVHGRDFEQAFGPLGKAAAMAEDGDLYVQLAQLYMAREKWNEAAKAVEKGLKKGKLTDQANAHLLLGIVHYSADKKVAARKAFEKAIRFEATRKAATQWLRSLEKR